MRKSVAFLFFLGVMMMQNTHADTTAFGPVRHPGFSVGIEMPSQVPITRAVEGAIAELGIDYINYYIITQRIATQHEDAVLANDAMMEFCDRLGLDFSIASHHIDPPADTIQKASANPRFQGIVIDELEHIRQLQAIDMAAIPQEEMFAPLANYQSLQEAQAAVEAGFVRLRELYESQGSKRNVSTHVWPSLIHTAASAGWLACPKIAKETYSSVSFAIGLGAAIQYSKEFWVDCDLWFWDLIPGHDPEELKSNLLMAYWFGADRIYLEGSGFNLYPAAKQGIPFTLMTQITPDIYQLTAHGEVLRSFIRDYLPTVSRPWTWRDVKPDTAIIHFDDSDHGQRYIGGSQADFLFGIKGRPANPETGEPEIKPLRTTPDTDAWFGIWNLLTHQTTGRDGLTFFKQSAWQAFAGRSGDLNVSMHSWLARPAQSGRHRFFVPLPGAVVFDDKVTYEHLKGIPLLFLTGVQVSDETRDAILRCVDEGATCVVWGPLAVKSGIDPLWKSGVSLVKKEIPDYADSLIKMGLTIDCVNIAPTGGRLFVTDDFEHPDLRAHLNGMLGSPNEIRYRFTQGEVTLKKKTPDEVEVLVKTY